MREGSTGPEWLRPVESPRPGVSEGEEEAAAQGSWRAGTTTKGTGTHSRAPGRDMLETASREKRWECSASTGGRERGPGGLRPRSEPASGAATPQHSGGHGEARATAFTSNSPPFQVKRGHGGSRGKASRVTSFPDIPQCTQGAGGSPHWAGRATGRRVPR